MAAVEQGGFRFADVELCPRQGRFSRGGQEYHLRQKSFQVLLYLIEHRNRLVTKEELLSQIWEDAAVTDDALVQCIIDIRRALGDSSRQPRFIKTFPRQGYRFIGSVTELAPDHSLVVETEEITSVEVEFEEELKEAGAALAKALPRSSPQSWRGPFSLLSRYRIFWVAGLVLVLLVTGLLSIYIAQKLPFAGRRMADLTLPQLPGKRSLAVLHFENQSRNAELDWLREGLADMLITNLSRSESLTVLSRPQLNLLLQRGGHKRGERINLEQALGLAERSRAEVIVQGSFAKLGQKVRIEARLHDGRTGQFLAAESLIVDEPEKLLLQVDFFALQLARHLGLPPTEPKPVLTQVMTNNLAAYRYYSLALEKSLALENVEAFALLEKAIALDPEFAMAHARIGFTYTVTWNFPDKAKPYLEKAFELSHRLTAKDRLYISAWYAIANLDYPAAIEALRQVVEHYPWETEAYLRLGRLLEGEEQYEEALRIFKQGLVVDPEAKEIYNALGLLYSALGRHEEAIVMLQQHLTLAPEKPNSHDSLGVAYQWAGRFDAAQAAYEQALALNPEFEVATVHLGNLYFQQGRYREALDQYQRYIKLAKSKLERGRGYGCMAWVHWRKGELTKAAAAAVQELKYEPTAVWNSIVLALERGDRKQVEKLQKQFAVFPYTTRGTRTSGRYQDFFLGYIALKSGRPGEAIERLKEAVRHRPPIWATDAFEDCLANAYLELGQLDKAIAEYERILRLNPNYPLARYNLARACEQRGEVEWAETEYQRFLEIWSEADPDVPEVRAAKASLANRSESGKILANYLLGLRASNGRLASCR